jgi:hypothetical protein
MVMLDTHVGSPFNETTMGGYFQQYGIELQRGGGLNDVGERM